MLEFPEGLIGFPNYRSFVVVRTGPSSVFRWLQSLDEPRIAFLVTDPRNYIQTYSPGTLYGENMLVFTTVNIPHGKPNEMTINLAGPIAIDAESRQGRQIVLDSDAYTTRYRVFANESKSSEELAA
jgi:flagellar assembly factor FliW